MYTYATEPGTGFHDVTKSSLLLVETYPLSFLVCKWAEQCANKLKSAVVPIVVAHGLEKSAHLHRPKLLSKLT